MSPFPVTRKAHFKHTLAIHRRDDSPFGAGWGLRGVESLHAAPDGTVALVEGSGARTLFKPGGVITTIAGSAVAGFSGDGGPAKDAMLNFPVDVIVDRFGNTYIADAGNNRIRRIDAGTGIIQTIAGGGGDFSSENIPATQAYLGLNALTHFAASSVMSSDGRTIYFADTGWNRIRRINPDGTITTVAGTRFSGFSGDGGPALDAQFNSPTGVAFDALGNLFVTDMGNNRLRMIDAAGTISTIAGTGAASTEGDGLPALLASLNTPISVTVDLAGNLFMVENSMLIRRISPDGIISTFTGCPATLGFTEDGQNAASAAFLGITDVQAGLDGTLLLADRTNGRVRMLDAQGVLSTIAGTRTYAGSRDYTGDGGPATEAHLSGPGGLAMDSAGDVFIADTFGNAVRKVTNTSGGGQKIFIGEPWELSTLLQNPDGSYVRQYRNGGHAEYSPGGQITKRVDLNGNTVTYVYSGGLLVAVQIPTGEQYTLSYDNAGHLAQISDPAGRITRFVIDASGNLTDVIRPDGSSRSFAYNLAHQLTAQTDQEGATTQYLYDRYGKLVQSITPHRDAQGNQETRQYTHGSTQGVINELPAGTGTELNPAPGIIPDNPTTTTTRTTCTATDGRGNTSTIYTAAPGFVMQIGSGHSGPPETLQLNRRGSPEAIILATGLQVLVTYDAQGNPTLVREQASSGFGPFDTTASYAPIINKITSVTDALGRTTQLSYDANGNLTSILEACGCTAIQIAYTPKGLPVRFTDALGYTSRIVYDGATGNALQLIDQLGNATTLTRDAAGNVISVQDALGRYTQYDIDAMNRMISTTDALRQRIVNRYNRRGQLTRVTTARGNSTTYSYTPAGLLSSVTNPLGQSVGYAYDVARNLVGIVNARGQQTTITYDERDLPSTRQSPDDTVRYGFDLAWQLDSISNSGSSLMYNRDPAGRVVQELTGGAGLPQLQMSYVRQYDAVGNLTALQYNNLQGSDSGRLSYSWDSENQLVALTGFSGMTFGFSYDDDHRRTRLTRPNGVATNYVWDAASQLQSLVHTTPRGELSHFNYTYNAVGVRDSMTDFVVQQDNSSLGGAHSFGSDALDQVITVQHPASEAAFNPYETFAYDPDGNRSADRVDAPGAYVYDGADRIVSDARFDYVFDADGNMTQKTDRSTGLVTRYTHDAENRLLRVDLPSGDYATYSYDPVGRRFQKVVNGVTTKYAYDGSHLITEDDASSTLVARYTHGVSIDEPLAMERGGETYMFHLDGLGSVVQLTSSLGNVSQTYTYDTYGRIAHSSGTVANPFTFSGRELDLESGLYFYRARYYDPSSGRFLEEDPLGVDGFTYAANAPQMFTDPSGLSTQDPDWLDKSSNFAAGFGDVISFGLTRCVRKGLHYDSVVNTCSGWYTAGEVTGYVYEATVIVATAGGAGAGAGAGGTRAAVTATEKATVAVVETEGEEVTAAQVLERFGEVQDKAKAALDAGKITVKQFNQLAKGWSRIMDRMTCVTGRRGLPMPFANGKYPVP